MFSDIDCVVCHNPFSRRELPTAQAGSSGIVNRPVRTVSLLKVFAVQRSILHVSKPGNAQSQVQGSLWPSAVLCQPSSAHTALKSKGSGCGPLRRKLPCSQLPSVLDESVVHRQVYFYVAVGSLKELRAAPELLSWTCGCYPVTAPRRVATAPVYYESSLSDCVDGGVAPSAAATARGGLAKCYNRADIQFIHRSPLVIKGVWRERNLY